VGFVTRGRGVTIHRTDCINVLNLPEMERARLIEADWEHSASSAPNEKYVVEVNIFAHNETVLNYLSETKPDLTPEKISDITKKDMAICKEL